MKIEARGPEETKGPEARSVADEILEGGREFLEALALRLNEIVRKPNGRFVISYVNGQPGAKTPPQVQ